MVQAVLLTVMVMAIGLLAMISRVASSREGSASSSLAAAARQAAEFGFSETVAEMNRDSKGYLWITPLANWNSVSDADLAACGIFSASPPATNPIAGVASPQALPDSTDLSYRLSDYQPPANLPGTVSCGSFANRKGGTATLTIIGTAKRASGDVTTYTLKRSVSVGPAVSVFQTNILAARTVDPGDSRFPTVPTPPASLGDPSTWPDVSCKSGSGSSYSCNLTTSAGTQTANFNNQNNLKFPYDIGGSLPTYLPSNQSACISQDDKIQCGFKSIDISNIQFIVTANAPVVVYLSGSGTLPVLSVAANANLCSHSSPNPASLITSCTDANGDWQSLRFFGTSSTCPNPPQELKLHALAGALNIRNSFLWFPGGRLTVNGSVSASSSDPRGWMCVVSATPLTGLADQRIWPDRIFTPKIYRGYGSQEQTP